MPDDGVGCLGIMVLSDREEVISALGQPPLAVIGCPCLIEHAREQEHVLAVLHGGQDADGGSATAPLGNRIESYWRDAVVPDGHTASRPASQAAMSKFMVSRMWSIRRIRSGQ